jgi:hypothetical protein
MSLRVKTCHNTHELKDDGTPESVDNAIRNCADAVDNIACQHCSTKYFEINHPLYIAEKKVREIRDKAQ